MSLLNPALLSEEQRSERLRLVIEGTRLGMWDWNPKTGDLYFNDIWCEMLGYAHHELEPSYDEWEKRVHPDDLQGALKDLSDHIAGRTSFYENTHRMRHRNGHWVYILDRGRVVEYDDEGNAVRFTGTHTDVTKEKEAECAAQAASKAKSQFLATMSHEIRTPLNGVLGVLQLLEETPLNSEQSSYLEIIRSSGNVLVAVINDILDFSKIEAKQMSIHPRPQFLRPVLNQVLQVYEQKSLEKGVKTLLELDSDVPQILEFDEVRLKQVLMNLVSNAIKFTSDGTVTVKCALEEGALVFRVVDTGKGIADPSKLGELFVQEDGSITRRFGGTGLGLAICKQLIDLMGGEFEIESTVDVGSTFTVRIPAVVAEHDAHLVKMSFESPLPSLKVLVAEDNPTNQMVARRMLEGLGMDVHIAKNGVTAVELCSREIFDVVLMDIHMPELDGLEATRKIRAELSASAPPIIALSADVVGDVRESAEAAGMSGFLTKPVEKEEVIRALQAVIA